MFSMLKKTISQIYCSKQDVVQQPQTIPVNNIQDITEKDFLDILSGCRDYTMLSHERLYANYQAIKYVLENDIKGDIVECGVWKGGSSMVFLQHLFNQKVTNRRIFLYDTFEGMSEPVEIDKKHGASENAMNKWEANQTDSYNQWCYSPLEEVQLNIAKTNYPDEMITLIKGKVEDTIPNHNHEKIAILRLDTDWYTSTKHELNHLFPLLINGGVLIIDDYGAWEGARKAVDEYFLEHKVKILLNRIDSTGRMGIKN